MYSLFAVAIENVSCMSKWVMMMMMMGNHLQTSLILAKTLYMAPGTVRRTDYSWQWGAWLHRASIYIEDIKMNVFASLCECSFSPLTLIHILCCVAHACFCSVGRSQHGARQLVSLVSGGRLCWQGNGHTGRIPTGYSPTWLVIDAPVTWPSVE